MYEVAKIKNTFKTKYPNFPVLAIWDAEKFYLVGIEIKNGNELADGYFKVDKNNFKIDEKWGYQSNLAEFKEIIKKPAIYLKKSN